MEALPPGEMIWLEWGREEILVANVGGKIYAMDNVCSHSGGSLADGYLRGCIAHCPLHGWEYDVRNGVCTHIRNERLRTFETEVRDGQIFVLVEDDESAGGKR